MNDLKEFQKRMPSGFDSISVDIVGFCNAKCKYCPAGTGPKVPQYMTLDLLEAILNKLIEYKFVSELSNFHVYGLGEPCLHPQVNDVLRMLKKYNISTAINTNASFVPVFEADSLEAVNRFLISMPGFSQSSYSKIHGFNFEKITENIISLRSQVKVLSNDRIPFDMSYHIYQFNEAEMVPAKEFCDKYNIRFAPNYAVMIDKDKCLNYATDKMSYEELKDISKEIFLGVLDQQIKDSPRNYCDFQQNFLSINADGDIRICSSFRKEAESNILVGNLITDNVDEIIWRKYHHPRCATCISAGLTLAHGYECKVYPNGYYSIMKENEFILNSNSDEKLKQRVKLLRLVRKFEEEGTDELKEMVLKHAAAHCLEGELQLIAEKYTRFGMKTYEKLTHACNVIM